MADFSALKTAIRDAIKQNGNEEITGTLLQQILLSMVTTLGDSAINSLLTALNTAVTNLTNAIGDESTARQSADTSIVHDLNVESQTRAYEDSQLENAIQAEANARQLADNSLSNNISAEASARITAVTNEAASRVEGDNALQLQINEFNLNLTHVVEELRQLIQSSVQGEANARQASDNTLAQSINAEAQTRANAIANEASTRANAILNEAQIRANAILNEASIRLNEDNKLQLQINGIALDFDNVVKEVRNILQDYSPIIINGNVSNAPDENDLTTTPNNLLKFKDNVYNPLVFSGMGKKFLRKNLRPLSPSYDFDGFVENISTQEELSGIPTQIFWDRERECFVGLLDGVYYLAWTDDDAYVPTNTENIYMYDGNPYKWNGTEFYVDDEELPNIRNILTQDMLNEENTIYVIRYDYTIVEDITIPANSILEFDGGSINGEYTVTGNNTGIKAGLVNILGTDLTISGTWNIEGWYVEWFGAKADGVTDCTLALQKLATFNDTRVILACGKYVVTDTINALGSTSTWVGSVASSQQFQREGTTILYKGDSDIVVLYLPNAAENICVSGDHNVNDDATNFVGTGIILGGYGSNWTANGRYKNITARFFKVGIHLDASFGCVFNGLKVTNNYIGIDADPICIDGQDSGYITILTINSFQIVGNKKHGIYKGSDNNRNGGIRINFNNGYLESNGNADDAQIKGVNALHFSFNNSYSEGTNTLIDSGNNSFLLYNCKFVQTARIYAETGFLIIINSELYNCIIEGGCGINAQNSSIKKIADFNQNSRGYNLGNVDYGDSLNLTGVEGRTVVNRVGRSYIKNKIDNWKLGDGYFVYDGDLRGFVFLSNNYLSNIPITSTRPELTNTYKGVCLFDTSINRPVFWTGIVQNGWIGSDGFSIGKRAGTTANRPKGLSQGGVLRYYRDEGYQYFDTDLGKPIWAKAINNSTGVVTWVDATGTEV